MVYVCEAGVRLFLLTAAGVLCVLGAILVVLFP